jgi:hypothetical protein
MSDTQKRIIIGSLISALVIIIALIIWWFLFRRPQTPVIAPPTPTSTAPAVTAVPAINPASEQRIAEEKSYPLGLKQLAMSFAERYGSYSSDEPSLNLSDLESFMTNRLVNSGKLKPQIDAASPVFIGFSSKALLSDLTQITPTAATIIVRLQRVQTTGQGITNTFYSNLRLDAVKIGDTWKIDDAAWQ